MDGFQDLGCLSHEPDAAKDDHILVRLGSFAGKIKRITGKVWDGMEQRRFHVIVTQDDRVALFFKFIDLDGNLGLIAQFHVGHNAAQFGFH